MRDAFVGIVVIEEGIDIEVMLLTTQIGQR